MWVEHSGQCVVTIRAKGSMTYLEACISEGSPVYTADVRYTHMWHSQILVTLQSHKVRSLSVIRSVRLQRYKCMPARELVQSGTYPSNVEEQLDASQIDALSSPLPPCGLLLLQMRGS